MNRLFEWSGVCLRYTHSHRIFLHCLCVRKRRRMFFSCTHQWWIWPRHSSHRTLQHLQAWFISTPLYRVHTESSLTLCQWKEANYKYENMCRVGSLTCWVILWRSFYCCTLLWRKWNWYICIWKNNKRSSWSVSMAPWSSMKGCCLDNHTCPADGLQNMWGVSTCNQHSVYTDLSKLFENHF